jgi:hypothetical protein
MPLKQRVVSPSATPDSIGNATRLAYQQLGIAYRQLGLLLDDVAVKQGQELARLTQLSQQQSAEIEKLRKRLAELDNYLKKCDDKPDRTVPPTP